MGDVHATARAAGSAEARFALLYELHYRALRDYCRRRVAADRVDDAVAETYLTAWRRLDDVPAGHEALLWLYRVAYRVVGHQWRSMERRRRLTMRLGSIADCSVPEPDDVTIEREDERLALQAASSLGDTDAEVLRLAMWEQLSIAEIAGLLDIKPNAVKQRLHRARRSLATEYRRLSTQPEATRGVLRGVDR